MRVHGLNSKPLAGGDIMCVVGFWGMLEGFLKGFLAGHHAVSRSPWVASEFQSPRSFKGPFKGSFEVHMGCQASEGLCTSLQLVLQILQSALTCFQGNRYKLDGGSISELRRAACRRRDLRMRACNLKSFRSDRLRTGLCFAVSLA